MSETGATKKQIEAAIERTPGWNDTRGCSEQRRNEHLADSRKGLTRYAEYLVPPGMVIARAEDVLTPEDRAAIGRVVEWACDPLGVLRESDIDVLRALATGGTDE